MTDIVERLGRDLMEISYDDIEAMVRDAADEIERLRAALQQIITEAESDDGLTAWDGADIARRALEPKP